MTIAIHHIETLVPETSYSQEEASRKIKAWTGNGTANTAKRYIEKIYRNSGILKRHSVIADFGENTAEALFRGDDSGKLHEPSTAERNDRYAKECSPLAVKLAQRTVSHCPAVKAQEITHVITVSCTGFYNPGPDIDIVNGLGLSPSTQRFHLGFMGCYAAFPALRMATQFCLADPTAVVLIICLELCTLHFQITASIDTVLANSVFADGCSAALVSAKNLSGYRPSFAIGPSSSTLLTDGGKDMVWSIGNNGFDLVLSRYIPRIIGANIHDLIESILEQHHLSHQEISLWAIHPGGKAILDKIQEHLQLEAWQIEASRNTLRTFGNMSSATIFFVLKDILHNHSAGKAEKVCALAFGPGLTVEVLFLELS